MDPSDAVQVGRLGLTTFPGEAEVGTLIVSWISAPRNGRTDLFPSHNLIIFGLLWKSKAPTLLLGRAP